MDEQILRENSAVFMDHANLFDINLAKNAYIIGTTRLVAVVPKVHSEASIVTFQNVPALTVALCGGDMHVLERKMAVPAPGSAVFLTGNLSTLARFRSRLSTFSFSVETNVFDLGDILNIWRV